MLFEFERLQYVDTYSDLKTLGEATSWLFIVIGLYTRGPGDQALICNAKRH
jgi:hypothetical protein